ncbi:MAG TPA: right-handed parallel beta-helix repeat-containing protein [Flavobacteriales bacterium]|nr:right-handed parallel beta-helix repeat-containing protein [Flavobacteriales bacterium]HMR28172.1 right-handed parallel beta-helix repeat-containing protein [Flavobacteriales bacterium]
MNPQLILLSITASLFASGVHAQLTRIVVQGTGAPQVFTDLDQAVAAAQPEDKLYFSGGTFPYTGGLVLDKPLHFIGAGIIPDSAQTTGVTTLNGVTVNEPLYILTQATGSTFTGIRFTRTQWDGSPNTTSVMFGNSITNDAPTDVVFQRCWFQRHLVLGQPNSPAANTNTTIDECILLGLLVGENHTATVTRSIVAHGSNQVAIASFLAGGLTVENCVVLGTIQNTYGAIIRNSVIRTNGGYSTYGCANCVLEHNITPNTTIASSAPGAVLTNNLESVDPATIFIAETNGFYELTDDLRMAPGSPGLGFGTDSTDAGVYGTSSPYKAGGVPYNPHYRDAVIGPATNPDGTLPVNIRVSAQSH